MEALSDRQMRALGHRAKQRENGESDFARGVNDTVDHLAAALRSFEGDPSGLAGHLRARVRGGVGWEVSGYGDGIAAVLDDIASILANDTGIINDIINYGRDRARAEKEN